MKGLCGVVVGSIVSAAAFTASAGAAPQASGDTCTAAGSGTSYTLHITIPSGSQQSGFAFGVAGATVTNAVIPGANGSFSVQDLAANTTGSFLSDAPLTGAPIATLTLSGAPTGGFTVVPAGLPPAGYMSPISCALSSTAPAREVAIAVAKHATYSPATKTWHLVVTVPQAGTLSAAQLVSTIGTAGAKQVTEKALVQAKRIGSKSAGKVTLTLKPTASGRSALAAKGSLALKLRVTFDTAGGKSANRIVALTLMR